MVLNTNEDKSLILAFDALDKSLIFVDSVKKCDVSLLEISYTFFNIVPTGFSLGSSVFEPSTSAISFNVSRVLGAPSNNDAISTFIFVNIAPDKSLMSRTVSLLNVDILLESSPAVYPDKSNILSDTFVMVSYIPPIFVPLIFISTTSTTLKLASLAVISVIIKLPDALILPIISITSLFAVTLFPMANFPLFIVMFSSISISS